MPFSPQWALSQLLSYSPLQWLAFLAVAAAAAYWGRWWEIVGGCALVGVLVWVFDLAYYGHHTREMDLDLVFGMGVFGRVILINAALIPVGVLALWLSYRRSRALYKPGT